MFLVDLCSINNAAIHNDVESLLRLILSFRLIKHVKMVFAMTSGLRIHLPSQYRHLHTYFSLMYTMQKCRFTLFNKNKAKLYIEKYKENCSMSINEIREPTNFNPYYLSQIDANENKYKNKARIKAEVAAYFNELVQSFSHNDLCAWMLPELEAAQRWLYKSSNGVHLSYDDFNELWRAGYTHSTFVKKRSRYLLTYALPLSDIMLVAELAKLRKTITLPSNPVIDGFVFEENMFRYLNIESSDPRAPVIFYFMCAEKVKL